MGVSTQYLCNMFQLLVTALFLLTGCIAQAPGEMKKNLNLKMDIQECSGQMDCKTLHTKVTLDSNWRWLHAAGEAVNCYDGNLWDDELCPDAETCTENCVLEGVDAADWRDTYGVKTDGKGLTLNFVTQGPYSTNIGSRMYLLAPGGDEYQIFRLKNREFTFDVDVSELPCGLNGALYFVEMDYDGGMENYPTNTAGAAYGTGYCDAQCPHDMKWISGETNCEEWEPSDNDANAGRGYYGSCCVEMDIWESNSVATAYTPHPCDTEGQYRCEGTECGDNWSDERYDGICDKDGCDFNSWRLGDQSFFGPGNDFAVNTEKPMTVVTQFITSDGTDNGDLVEIRRLYVQDGKIIDNSFTNLDGIDSVDSITDEFCGQTKVVFGDVDDHGEHGGLKTMGDSMDRGHVLVMSMWDDHDANMLWLDSNYPLDKDPSQPGVNRGPCPEDSGEPSDMESNYPDATVKYYNVKFGDIGSTYPGGDATPTAGPTTTTRKPTTTSGDNSECPGDDLSDCMSMCPTEPLDIFQGCILECQDKCS